MFARSGGAEPGQITELVGFKGGRHKPLYRFVPPSDAHISLRSIEPLIVIVLKCICRKGAEADEVRR
jgi:hypothetical protein